MHKQKILIVDDSRVALMTISMTLRRQACYEIVEAKNGQEAVELAVGIQPDLILMDVNMPVLDGFDACRTLRSHPKTASIPIILVTTRGEASNIAAGFASGCTDYVTKPVNSTELLTKIQNILA